VVAGIHGWYVGLPITVVVLLVLYIFLTYSSAVLEVKNSPREAMYECPTHGIMRQEHLIHHLGQKICPKCFDEKIKTRFDGSIRVS